MPELASPIGYRLQPQVFQPISPTSYFNRQLPVQPAIPADKVAKAQVFGSLVKALGELPGQLNKEWTAGKKRGIEEVEAEAKRKTEKEVRQRFSTALTSAPTQPQLSDFRVNADGGVVLNPANPLMEAAKIKHLENSPVGRTATPKTNLHSTQEALFLGDNPATGPVTAGASGGVEVGAPLPVKDATGASSTTGAQFPDSLPIDGMPTADEATQDNEETPDSAPDLSPLSSVAPDQMQQIDAGVSNAVNQLSGLTPESLTASNEPAGQPAPITPATPALLDEKTNATRPLAALKPEIRKALPVVGKSVNHENGEVYLRSANGSVQTYDPVTRIITLDSSDGSRYELLPGSNQWRKAEKKVEDTELEAIADAIVAGDQPPDMKGFYKKSVPLRSMLAKRGYDLSQAQNDWYATQRNIATMNGPQQLRVRQAVNFTYHSLGLIEDLGHEWAAGRFPLLNKAQLQLAKQGVLGQDAQSLAQRLEAQINDLVSELGTVYKGGNSSTDATLRLAAENLKADFSEKTLMDSIALIRKNLKIRENSLNHVMTAGASENSPYGAKPGEEEHSAAPAVSQKDKDAAAWVKSNPTDPRAPKIKAALKARGIPVE